VFHSKREVEKEGGDWVQYGERSRRGSEAAPHLAKEPKFERLVFPRSDPGPGKAPHVVAPARRRRFKHGEVVGAVTDETTLVLGVTSRLPPDIAKART